MNVPRRSASQLAHALQAEGLARNGVQGQYLGYQPYNDSRTLSPTLPPFDELIRPNDQDRLSSRPLTLPPLSRSEAEPPTPPPVPQYSWMDIRRTSTDLTAFTSNRPPSPASSFGSVNSGVSHPPRTGDKRKRVVTMTFDEFSMRANEPTDSDQLSRVEAWTSSTQLRLSPTSPAGGLAYASLPQLPAPDEQYFPSHGSGWFKCEHPGCDEPLFRTQYALNSHRNVHRPPRQFHCPVAGCSRGEGGKGYRLERNMIYHVWSQHDSGYVCPFCPDKDHKYRRPIHLKSHVRVHHSDKDKNDPQVQEAIARGSDRGPRKRRKRTASYEEFLKVELSKAGPEYHMKDIG